MPGRVYFPQPKNPQELSCYHTEYTTLQKTRGSQLILRGYLDVLLEVSKRLGSVGYNPNINISNVYCISMYK